MTCKVVRIFRGLVGVFLLLFQGDSLAQNLEGVWIADQERTREFNDGQAILSEADKSQIECSWAEYLVTADIITVYVEGGTCLLRGREINRREYFRESKYQVIARDSEKLILKFLGREGSDSYQVLHFVDDNHYWIYHFGEVPEYDQHYRKYYARVTNENTPASRIKN